MKIYFFICMHKKSSFEQGWSYIQNIGKLIVFVCLVDQLHVCLQLF